MILAGLFRVWPLFWVFVTFNVIFGAIEIISKAKTGSTVSQTFWKFYKEHIIKSIIILVAMLAMWLALLAHLGLHWF
jgi:hypothetical protein